MNAVVEWLGAPVEYLGFNWVACIFVALAVALSWRLAVWSAYRHPATWERPMTRVTLTQPRDEAS